MPPSPTAVTFARAESLDRRVCQQLRRETDSAWRALLLELRQGLDASTVDPQRLLATFRSQFRERIITRLLRLFPGFIAAARTIAYKESDRALQGHFTRKNAHGRMSGLPWRAAAEDPDEDDQAFLLLPDPWGKTPIMRLAFIEALTLREITQYLHRWTALYQAEQAVLRDLAQQRTPQKLQQLARLVRRSMQMDPVAKRQTLQAINRPDSNLAQAVQTGNTMALRQALDTFVQQRAKWRVEQLVRNEVHRANQETLLQEYMQHAFVQAVRWRLSPTHGHTDRCDLLARANLGLGPGVYYKLSIPRRPHPNCQCRVEPVLAPLSVTDPRPFLPSNTARYATAMDALVGPMSLAADRLGRAEDPSAFAALLADIPQTPPAPH